ncbi:unnamed protein product [Chilo suppressalis]|uniref:BESS domain-containing protein n=1 Tax=Chilo suppressalis TaxID=168631 RepID=A0ABN8LE39_CHISP|nr:hypothetical protein evm_007413 [Chilo suppressalis]CAH2986413.1 unnamed protein product [Chilo suppressalis]
MSDDSFFNPPVLIEEVKRRPALYTTDQPVDREERLMLWKEIGAAIYPEWDSYNKATAYDKVLQLQKKWRSLRDAYNRELRARQTGDRRGRHKVYKYFKRMSFLGGFNGSVSEEDDHNMADSHSNNEDAIILLEREDTPEPPRPRKTRKRQQRTRSSDIPAPEEMELPLFSLEAPNDNDDSDKLFMLSFLPEMRQLPSNLKMWVRAQIANAMQEAVSCHYNNTQPSLCMSSDKNGQDIKRQRYDSGDD